MPGLPPETDPDSRPSSIVIAVNGRKWVTQLSIIQSSPDSPGENWSTNVVPSGTGTCLVTVSIDARNLGGSLDAYLYTTLDGVTWFCIGKMPTVAVDTKAVYVLSFGGKQSAAMTVLGEGNQLTSNVKIPGNLPSGVALRLKSNAGTVLGRDQYLRISRIG